MQWLRFVIRIDRYTLLKTYQLRYAGAGWVVKNCFVKAKNSGSI